MRRVDGQGEEWEGSDGASRGVDRPLGRREMGESCDNQAECPGRAPMPGAESDVATLRSQAHSQVCELRDVASLNTRAREVGSTTALGEPPLPHTIGPWIDVPEPFELSVCRPCEPGPEPSLALGEVVD